MWQALGGSDVVHSESEIFYESLSDMLQILSHNDWRVNGSEIPLTIAQFTFQLL